MRVLSTVNKKCNIQESLLGFFLTKNSLLYVIFNSDQSNLQSQVSHSSFLTTGLYVYNAYTIFQTLSSPGNVTFTDPGEATAREAKALVDEGVDIIVLLSHCGLQVDKYVRKMYIF